MHKKILFIVIYIHINLLALRDDEPTDFNINKQLDYYALMQISSSASQQEIRKAYLRLAHRLHPDRNNNQHATYHFQELSRAYETLKNPETRRVYDAQIQHKSLIFNWYTICITDFFELFSSCTPYLD